jgi:hypothetical protein
MVYLRTVSGSFLKAESIVGLAAQHGDDGKIVGWLAVRPDGSTTPLAGFYSTPGRIEKALPHLFSAPAPVGPPPRRRFIVPFTDKGVRINRLPPEPGRPPSHSPSAPSTDLTAGAGVENKRDGIP